MAPGQAAGGAGVAVGVGLGVGVAVGVTVGVGVESRARMGNRSVTPFWGVAAPTGAPARRRTAHVAATRRAAA